ncbi:MAG: hypothetical protein V4543_17670 [Bacteroidota bacterium]
MLGPIESASLMPSIATLRRFLDPQSDAGFRKDLFKALSIYLGYSSYAAFRAAHAHMSEPANFALVHIKRVHQHMKAGVQGTM